MKGRALRIAGVDYPLVRVSEERLREIAARTVVDGEQMLSAYPFMFAETEDGCLLLYPEMPSPGYEVVETDHPGPRLDSSPFGSW